LAGKVLCADSLNPHTTRVVITVCEVPSTLKSHAYVAYNNAAVVDKVFTVGLHIKLIALG